jgi:hypothetical protein
MSNKLSDIEFMRKFEREQNERYPEIINRDIILSNKIDKMMNQRQNTINKQDAKLEKPRNSAGSSCLYNNEK